MNTNVDAGAEELRVNHQSMSQSKEVMSSDPEVLEKPTRRRFTAEYKLQKRTCLGRSFERKSKCTHLGKNCYSSTEEAITSCLFLQDRFPRQGNIR